MFNSALFFSFYESSAIFFSLRLDKVRWPRMASEAHKQDGPYKILFGNVLRVACGLSVHGFRCDEDSNKKCIFGNYIYILYIKKQKTIFDKSIYMHIYIYTCRYSCTALPTKKLAHVGTLFAEVSQQAQQNISNQTSRTCSGMTWCFYRTVTYHV